MFEEILRIVFDRRHIKNVRLWVMVVVVMACAASVYTYHRMVVSPIQERQDRQGKKIKLIIRAAKLQARMDALTDEKGD